MNGHDKDNYLKNAELDIEGEEAGYDMIDGIINNVPSTKDMRDYGYLYDGMDPLDKTGALAAFDSVHQVYLLYPDDTEGAAENRAEIEAFDGFFGIENGKPSVIEQIAEAKAKTAPPNRTVTNRVLEDRERGR